MFRMIGTCHKLVSHSDDILIISTSLKVAWWIKGEMIQVPFLCQPDIHVPSRLVQTDKCFVSFSTCNPKTCSHWLTQSKKEADIYYLFIIG